MPDGTGVDATMQCLFCGEQEHVEVFEVWGHDFMLHTCCEGLHEQIAFDLNDDPAWARRFLQRLSIEELCGHELRRPPTTTGAVSCPIYRPSPCSMPAARHLTIPHRHF